MQIDDLCEIREIPLILSVVNFPSFFCTRVWNEKGSISLEEEKFEE